MSTGTHGSCCLVSWAAALDGNRTCDRDGPIPRPPCLDAFSLISVLEMTVILMIPSIGSREPLQSTPAGARRTSRSASTRRSRSGSPLSALGHVSSTRPLTRAVPFQMYEDGWRHAAAHELLQTDRDRGSPQALRD